MVEYSFWPRRRYEDKKRGAKMSVFTKLNSSHNTAYFHYFKHKHLTIGIQIHLSPFKGPWAET